MITKFLLSESHGNTAWAHPASSTSPNDLGFTTMITRFLCDPTHGLYDCAAVSHSLRPVLSSTEDDLGFTTMITKFFAHPGALLLPGCSSFVMYIHGRSWSYNHR